MHCSKARRKLAALSGQPVDPELREHLQHCAKCAQLAQAARLLERACDSISEDPLDLPSLAMLRTGVERRLRIGTTSAREKSFMSELKQQLWKRPRLGLGIGLAVVALLFLTLIPFTVEKTIGYEVAFAGVDENLALDDDRLNEFLLQLGIEHADFDVSDCDKVCNVRITELGTEDEARLLVAAFGRMSNVIVLEGVEECQENVSCSMIEIVAGGVLVGSHVSLTDEEIEQIMAERIGDSVQCNIWIFDKDNLDSGENVIFFGEGDQANFNHQVMISCHPDSLPPGCCPGDSGQVMCVVMAGDCGPGGVSGSHGHLDQLLAGLGLTFEELMAGVDETTQQLLAEHGIVFEVTETADGQQEVKIKVTHQESSGEGHRHVDTENDPVAKTAEPILPDGYELAQNYPNPFNPTTNIEYELGNAEQVTLEIVNINGQVVRQLVDDYQGAGVHTVQWDATNESGERVASGVYFYRITAGDFSQSKRMMLLK